MSKIFDRIDERQRDWIGRQRLFFTGTAPLDGEGHVNVSPKGPIDTFRVLDDHTVAYLDFVGSGAETIAHLRENGRIVVMLCAFEGPPRILRLHGTGEIVESADRRFEELFEQAGFVTDEVEAVQRAIIVVDVTRIADSCGYGVPLMSYAGERPHSKAWADKKLRVGGEAEIEKYKAAKNAVSIDGLPALESESKPAATLRE